MVTIAVTVHDFSCMVTAKADIVSNQIVNGTIMKIQL